MTERVLSDSEVESLWHYAAQGWRLEGRSFEDLVFTLRHWQTRAQEAERERDEARTGYDDLNERYTHEAEWSVGTMKTLAAKRDSARRWAKAWKEDAAEHRREEKRQRQGVIALSGNLIDTRRCLARAESELAALRKRLVDAGIDS